MSVKQFRTLRTAIGCLVVLIAVAMATAADDQPIDKKAQAARRPKTYIAIFINGYAGDPMPKEPAEFEKLLKAITVEGHFNAVLCKYTLQREALCKKYKVLMVVDLLADGLHVYRNPKECEVLLKKLRG
ncbi:MAG: hypothetical protein ISS69_15460, partial [Phycisphaerae bacterium]|nr:hypothetical protein [Phycisphaerae bacterium]